MNLTAVILQLRAANTSAFSNRIGGAAEYGYLDVNNPLTNEWAYVMQLSESCAPNNYDSEINQRLVERVGVVVTLQNDTNKMDVAGFTAYNRLSTVRNDIFKALLGWQMPGAESLMYYAGGRMLYVDRAYLIYQFEFECMTRLQTMYDSGAGSLPLLQKFFDQWANSNDPALANNFQDALLTLPTNVLSPPYLADMIYPKYGFANGFGKGFMTLATASGN